MFISINSSVHKDHGDSVLITPTEADGVDGDVLMEFVNIGKGRQR